MEQGARNPANEKTAANNLGRLLHEVRHLTTISPDQAAHIAMKTAAELEMLVMLGGSLHGKEK